MKRREFVRRVVLAITILFLLVLAWATLWGAVRQLPRAHSVGQQIETGIQIVCGALTLLVAATTFGGRRWRRQLHITWMVSIAGTAGLSGLVWGPAMPGVALLMAVASLVVGWGVVRLLRFAQGRSSGGSCPSNELGRHGYPSEDHSPGRVGDPSPGSRRR